MLLALFAALVAAVALWAGSARFHSTSAVSSRFESIGTDARRLWWPRIEPPVPRDDATDVHDAREPSFLT